MVSLILKYNMRRIISIVLLFLNPSITWSQGSKKETNDYYQQIHKTDTAEIRKGQHLELAQYFTIEHFVAYYLEHGKTLDTKKNRLQTIEELFSDSEATYFGKTCSHALLEFFKVNATELSKLNLEKLDGNKIRQQFIEQIIPQSDKDLERKREKMHSSFYNNPKFTYEYQKHNNFIVISYRWRISGDFFIRIIDKTYSAKLDLTRYKLT